MELLYETCKGVPDSILFDCISNYVRNNHNVIIPCVDKSVPAKYEDLQFFTKNRRRHVRTLNIKHKDPVLYIDDCDLQCDFPERKYFFRDKIAFEYLGIINSAKVCYCQGYEFLVMVGSDRRIYGYQKDTVYLLAHGIRDMYYNGLRILQVINWGDPYSIKELRAMRKKEEDAFKEYVQQQKPKFLENLNKIRLKRQQEGICQTIESVCHEIA
ncbi:hypothetical protein [Scale drop disease virus]|uniref:ORF_074R n=1 Tax=Scale drop disease virus TaxID=1697349 RepID=A0A0K1L6I8_9VIRU|nr:ORF_074R [Scale drop disease virus]AKU37489.1 ORF_074R [Scale drop disease virus]QLI60749.1 hypothetical protein [Scale drop disease virus]QXJ13667.1 ORF074R [Scale drop disease virus]